MVGMVKEDQLQDFIFHTQSMFVGNTLGESLEWSLELK